MINDIFAQLFSFSAPNLAVSLIVMAAIDDVISSLYVSTVRMCPHEASYNLLKSLSASYDAYMQISLSSASFYFSSAKSASSNEDSLVTFGDM